jgi:hypothetical protein
LTHIVSDCISRHSVEQIVNAFAFSEYNNTPFTAFFTVAWSKTDNWTPCQLSTLQEQFSRNLRRWLERNALPNAYIYTVENGETVGFHTNVAVHIPRPLFWTFVQEAKSLVPGYNGNPCTLKFYSDRGKTEPKFYFCRNQRLGTLLYYLKGTDPKASFNTPSGRVRVCDHLGIRPIPQGEVIGHRARPSHGLGKEARARSGWSDYTAPDELKTALAYIAKSEVAA